MLAAKVRVTLVNRARLATSFVGGLMLLTRITLAQDGREAVRYLTEADRTAREEPARRDLLTGFVGEHVRRENVGETFGYMCAGFGILLGVQGAFIFEDDQPLGATWVATSAVSTTTVVTSLVLSRDTRVDLLQVNSWMLSGGFALGAAISEDAGYVDPLTLLGMSGAAFSYAGLKAINLASRRTPLRVLRREPDTRSAPARGAILAPLSPNV
jgi:hypothetical protein